MRSFDMWLLTQADNYWKGCEPEVISIDYEPEYGGELVPIYNISCQQCNKKNCEYWQEYNG